MKHLTGTESRTGYELTTHRIFSTGMNHAVGRTEVSHLGCDRVNSSSKHLRIIGPNWEWNRLPFQY
jgi:hypothetical protein